MRNTSQHSKSNWAAVNTDVLTDLFEGTTFNVKLTCESVCKTWRSALRQHPSPGVWGDTMLLTDNRRHIGVKGRIEGFHPIFIDLASSESHLAK